MTQRHNPRLRLLAAIVTGALAVMLAGCGGGDTGESGASASGDVRGKKVTLLTVTEQCDYCSRYLQTVRSAASKAGLDLDVKITDYDAAEQARQANQAIAARPDAIILWPADAAAAVPSIKRIVGAKIPLVISNSEPVDQQAVSEANTFTGPNDLENGKRAAEAMIAGLKARNESLQGDVVVVSGVPGNPPTIRRTQGFNEVLKQKAPGLRVAATQPGDWEQAKATTAASGLFTQTSRRDVKGLYAQNDAMAAGAIVAARRRNIDPSDLVIVGSNCTIEGVRGIESGAQYASVLQSPIDDGGYAVDSVVKILRGEEVPPKRYLPDTIITKDNVSDCNAAVGRD